MTALPEIVNPFNVLKLALIQDPFLFENGVLRNTNSP